jgi:DNA-binding transcriptional regulator YiaG
MGQTDQTTPYSGKTGSAVFCIPLTIMLSVGTGECLTQQICKFRESGQRSAYHSPDKNAAPSIYTALAPAADIALIRSVLKTALADLANCIGVSRQSLYNWKSGSNIKTENLSRLAQLKAAASVLLAENISGSPIFLKRKLPNGKTMLEAIAEGADGGSAAMSLVNMLRDEASRQKSLDQRFAARLATAPKSMDYGTPSFNEKG